MQAPGSSPDSPGVGTCVGSVSLKRLVGDLDGQRGLGIHYLETSWKSWKDTARELKT